MTRARVHNTLPPLKIPLLHHLTIRFPNHNPIRSKMAGKRHGWVSRNKSTKRADKRNVGNTQSVEADDASQSIIQQIQETKSMQISSGPRQQSNMPLTRTGEDLDDDSLLDPSDHVHAIKNPSVQLPPIPHSYASSIRSLPSLLSSSEGPLSYSRIESIPFSQPVELARCIETF